MRTRLIKATEVRAGDKVVYWRGTQTLEIVNVERAADDKDKPVVLVHTNGRTRVSPYAMLNVQREEGPGNG